MKKGLLQSLLVAATLAVSNNVMAGDKIVANYSFDDAQNPVLTAAGHSGYDYSYTSVATETVFLNLYDTDNNNNGDTQIALSEADLSGESWTLDFYWAAAGGTNNRPGYTRFFCGEKELFTITDDANGGKATSCALTYGSDGTVSLSMPAMNKSNRMKTSIATVYNKKNYWYHFVIKGTPEGGVKMTIADCNGNAPVLDEEVISAENVSPTSLSLRPAACGALGIDELKLSYFTDEAIANTPTVSLTKVSGNDRIYTISIGEGETLHYTVGAGAEQTSTTTETEVTITEDCDLVAWTTNGEAISEKVTIAVSTGAVKLADMKMELTSLSAGAVKTFNVTIDNSNVLLKPKATITYDFTPAAEGEALTGVAVEGTISATTAGTYTFTAAAEGYTSTTLTYENTELEQCESVDVTALDPTTISENWKKYAEPKVVGSSNQWAGKGFPDALDAYWYDFASETAAETDILKGLSLEVNAEGKTPQLFTTLGLMYPVHVLDAEGAEQDSPAITTAKVSIAEPEGKYAVITYRPGYGTSTTTIILKGDEVWDMNRFDKAITKYELFKEKSVTPEPVADDYTSYIANADLKGEGGWNAEGTKGIDQSGIVKCGNNAQYDFSQTIASLPAGQYVLEVKAVYRYSGSEADEYAAIQAGTETKLAELYATIGENTVTAAVKNRYDGASATDHAQGNGSVQVNDLWVPNSSAAVQAWFAAGAYANELSLIVTEESSVTIGIRKSAQPEAGDYTVIGPWTLTRLGDVVADAIATVKSEQTTREGIYNLAGQRVMKAAKGLYIINGKKVVK